VELVQILEDGSTVSLDVGTPNIYVEITDSGLQPLADRTASFGVLIDASGVALQPGDVGVIDVPFPCSIMEWRLFADIAGDLVLDIRKQSYDDYDAPNPSNPADSITGSAQPTLAGASKAKSSTLTGWSAGITTGDTLRLHILAAAGITRVTLALKVLRT
jgi:hypothetical protein